MFHERDIQLYFQSLPKDLVIKINDSSYSVNKNLLSFFSPKIAELLTSDINELSLPFNDDHCVFPIILSYIHNNKIDINEKNDVYLMKLSNELGIASLSQLAEESTQKEITVMNVIIRLMQNVGNESEKMISILHNNIEVLIQTEEVFSLGLAMLSKVFHSKEALFSTIENRQIFGFKCARLFPESFNQFFNEEELKSVSPDVYKEIFSSNMYNNICSKIPSLLICKILHETIDELNQRESFLNDEINHFNEEINSISNKEQSKSKQVDELTMNLNAMHEMETKLQNSLNFLGERIMNQAVNIQQLSVTQDVITDISRRIRELSVKSKEMEQLSEKIQHIVLFYPESRQKVRSISNDWVQKMSKLEALLACIYPNDAEISKLSSELSSISKALMQTAQEVLSSK